ncbi:glycosyltransferase [Marinihelvus fidelis]|uniref:Glycosyltransferase n=1 Tax=Marinihelvus fidelis TaxID=2613842 RepID=A0A5N0T3V7_9GAMM|nr:glycosyltransferase [Marinihelvus fidelis]KAA9129745.1 glycosyltransferase [Marinihelvus fidelis]
MMNSQPLVSVCVICFNHAEFLARSLDSILDQRTDFLFEIVVRDDCSSDESASIIRKYHAEFPDKITPIYEKRNQYSLGIQPLWPVIRKARGKYLAICEGDDFWIDTNKLQSQINYLENNLGVSVLFENAEVREFDKTGKLISKRLFNSKLASGRIEPWQIISDWITPTATVMFRKEMLPQKYWEITEFPFGDIPLILSLSESGAIHYRNRVSAVYRSHPSGMVQSTLHKLEAAEKFIAYFQQYESIFPDLGLHEAARKRKSEHYAWIIWLCFSQKEFGQGLRHLIEFLRNDPVYCIRVAIKSMVKLIERRFRKKG